MPSCRTNRGYKKKRQSNIELDAILKFVKFIQLLSGGMLGISILGLILVGNNIQARVLYTMVIVVNIVVILGGIIPIRILEKKSKNESAKL